MLSRCHKFYTRVSLLITIHLHKVPHYEYHGYNIFYFKIFPLKTENMCKGGGLPGTGCVNIRSTTKTSSCMNGCLEIETYTRGNIAINNVENRC